MTRKSSASAKTENAPKIRTTIFAVKKRQQILKNKYRNSKQDREVFGERNSPSFNGCTVTFFAGRISQIGKVEETNYFPFW